MTATNPLVNLIIMTQIPPNPSRQSTQLYSQIVPLLMILFYLFGFRFIEPYVIPPIQAWINSSGSLAWLSYFGVGLISTVIAPISIGPINVVMQKAFGLWSAWVIFYGFISVGQIINFSISKRFGSKIVHKLFPFLESDPIFGWLKNNLDRSTSDLVLIYMGIGGELISYLFGLNRISYPKFLCVCLTTNVFNSFLFVSRNLSIGTNWFVFWMIVEIITSTVPLIIVFWSEIQIFKSKFKVFLIDSKKLESDFRQNKLDFKNDKITQQDFNQFKANYDRQSTTISQQLFSTQNKNP